MECLNVLATIFRNVPGCWNVVLQTMRRYKNQVIHTLVKWKIMVQFITSASLRSNFQLKFQLTFHLCRGASVWSMYWTYTCIIFITYHIYTAVWSNVTTGGREILRQETATHRDRNLYLYDTSAVNKLYMIFTF